MGADLDLDLRATGEDGGDPVEKTEAVIGDLRLAAAEFDAPLLQLALQEIAAALGSDRLAGLQERDRRGGGEALGQTVRSGARDLLGGRRIVGAAFNGEAVVDDLGTAAGKARHRTERS